MTAIEVFTWIFQLVLPLTLVARVAMGKGTAWSWGTDLALAAAAVAAGAAAGLWLALPWYLPGPLAVAWVAAALLGLRRRGWRIGSTPLAAVSRRASWLAHIGFGFRILGLFVFVGLALLAGAGGRWAPGTAVDLTFPLRGGTYLVANGGSNQVVNLHLATLEGERYRPYRGQSYAVDLVRVGVWGSRRSGLSPNDPEGFAIFGDTVFAPCAGRVVVAVDGERGVAQGETPRTIEGNHVILECGEVWVVLAHFMRGSVAVSAETSVAAGRVLGRAGNSGQSDEPHLHVHLQTPGSAQAPMGGEPVHVTFGGRFLRRNDRVTSRPSGPP